MTDAHIRSILLTGATGFIGRNVLARLAARSDCTVTCLVRRTPGPDGSQGSRPAVRFVEGDLLAPASCSAAIREADTVIHLAAATGGATTAELQRVNVDATRALVDAANAAAVSRFVFMSTIAVKADPLPDYPYAASKAAAEREVARFTGSPVIVRPTIVLGAGSPNWATLRRLATLPVVPLIGGGTARVQPVAVDDVAAIVETLTFAAALDGPVVEVGGPEVLEFAQFLFRIRAACGMADGPRLPLPAGPIRVALKLAKAVLGERLPVGPGQVSAFVSDGVANPSPVTAAYAPKMQSLDDLLDELCNDR